MLSLFCAALIASANVAGTHSEDYADAYRQAEREGKPLMVLVSAQWCPACVSLKDKTLRQMQRSGELDDVCVAVVDCDAQPELAKQLRRGHSIPQLIVFAKRDGGSWKRTQLTGFQSSGPIRNLIRAAGSTMRRD